MITCFVYCLFLATCYLFLGTVVHEELTTKLFCEFMHELAKTTPHENVRTKLLELIQAWTFAFRKNPKHGALKVCIHNFTIVFVCSDMTYFCCVNILVVIIF